VSVSAPPQGSASGWIVYNSTTPAGPFWTTNPLSLSFSQSTLVTLVPQGAVTAQPHGTDYSQQDSPQLTLSDIASTGSNAITSVTGGFTGLMAGNIMQISGSFYEVTAVVNSNTAWLDRNITAGSGLSGVLGGPLSLAASPNTQTTGGPTSHKIFIRSGQYALPITGPASSGLFFNNPSVSPGNTTSGQPFKLVGYAVTRGDLGVSGVADARPQIVLNPSGGYTHPCVLNFVNAGVYVENLILNANQASGSYGINMPVSSFHVENCKIANFTNYGLFCTGGFNSDVFETEFTGGSSTATASIYSTSSSPVLVGNDIHNNYCPAIIMPSLTAMFNVIANNSGIASDGFRQSANNPVVMLNNTIDGNGAFGVNMGGWSNNSGHVFKNNLITNNASGGFIYAGSPGVPQGFYCDNNGYYNNGGGTTYATQVIYVNQQGNAGVAPWVSKDVNLTANPYQSSASGDYGLNGVSGGGQAAQKSGYPVQLPASVRLSYMDLGAYHSAYISAGNGGIPGIYRLLGGI
jgi:hypothetical protein